MRKLLILAALLLPGTAAVTGCGGGSARSDPGVATLHSDVPAGPQSPSPSAPQRPLLRPDISDAEMIALENAWTHCLAGHGVPVRTAGPGQLDKPTVDTTLPQYKAAVNACAAIEPEDWRAVEARTDPQYADRMRAEAQCLTDKGIKVSLQGQPPQLAFTDDRQVPRALELTPQCEHQAFGDVLKRFDAHK